MAKEWFCKPKHLPKLMRKPSMSPPSMWPLIWMMIAMAAAINGQMMPQPMQPMAAQPPQSHSQPGAAYGQVGGGPSMHGDADKSQLSLGGGYVSKVEKHCIVQDGEGFSRK